MNKGPALLGAVLIYILPLVFIGVLAGMAALLVREGQMAGAVVALSILGHLMFILFYHACLCSDQGAS